MRRITNDVGLRVGCIRGNDSAVGSTFVSLKTKRLAYKRHKVSGRSREVRERNHH